MNVWTTVGIGLLAAFALTLGTGVIGSLVGYCCALDQKVSTEERARYRLFSSRWNRIGMWLYLGFALIRTINDETSKPLNRWGERLLGPSVTAKLPEIFYSTLVLVGCVCGIIWAMRIFLQSKGICSVPLLQEAKISFALSVGGLLAIVFLLMQIV